MKPLRLSEFRLSVPLRLTLLCLSLLTFIAALPLTAFTQANSEEPIMRSYEVLEAGALGIFKGYIEWFANPLLLWSWLASYFNRPRASDLTAIVAFGFALIFLRRHEPVGCKSPATRRAIRENLRRSRDKLSAIAA